MVGDGVNDVLALKDADCSVAMASGSDAAAQASQLVLLESDFSKMPSVVREGRRVVNNLQRSGSLFLVKNIFSFLMALISIGLVFSYPLLPTQVSLVTMFTIGIPSFFLAQIPNEGLIKGNFIKNVIFNAAPAALTNLIMIFATTAIGANILHLERSSLSTVCTLVWGVVGLVYLIKLCRPFDKWKTIIVGGCAFGFIMAAVVLKTVSEKIFGMNIDFSPNAIGLFVGAAAIVPLMMFLMNKAFRWTMDTFFEKWIQTRIKKISDKVDNLGKKKPVARK